MAVTLMQIVDAITDTLDNADGMRDAWSQARGEIKESIPSGDVPLLQVYLIEGETSRSSDVDRKTFGKTATPPIRHFDGTVYVDVYARQRSYIGEDLQRCLIVASAVEDVLVTQDSKPFFGLEGIQHFHWRFQYVTFQYAETAFVGYRFTLNVGVF